MATAIVARVLVDADARDGLAYCPSFLHQLRNVLTNPLIKQLHKLKTEAFPRDQLLAEQQSECCIPHVVQELFGSHIWKCIIDAQS